MHDSATVGVEPDQSFGRQIAQRFAHRRGADLKVASHIGLHQARTPGNCSAQDCLAKRVLHKLMGGFAACQARRNFQGRSCLSRSTGARPVYRCRTRSGDYVKAIIQKATVKRGHDAPCESLLERAYAVMTCGSGISRSSWRDEYHINSFASGPSLGGSHKTDQVICMIYDVAVRRRFEDLGLFGSAIDVRS